MTFYKITNIISLLLAFGLSIFYPNLWILGILLLFFGWYSVSTFINDRRNLKNASFYIRSKKEKVGFFKLSLTLLFIALSTVLLIYYDLLRDIDTGAALFLNIIILTHMVSNHYKNFREAVRTYPEGLILPDTPNKLIHWSEIDNITLDSDKFIIQRPNQAAYVFSFNPADLEDARNIQHQFLTNG